LLAEEVLGTQTNHDDRSILIGVINRLSGVIGDHRKCLFSLFLMWGITSEDLLERILIAVSSSNVARRFQVGPGDNTQDANAVKPMLPLPVAILDLEAAGAGAGASAGASAADADRTQAVIDGAATVTDAAAAAKSESHDDSAPDDSRKRNRQPEADDDRKPPAK
jgi:hypothetical protein